MKYTNDMGISLPIAVMLATDLYDHNSDPNTISVTALLKGTKQVILGSRIPSTETVDISTLIASTIGTSVHSHLEDSWKNHYKQSMQDLGYPQKVIDKIAINPDVVTEGMYPVYLENRTSKKVGTWTVSGMYDLIIEGAIHDLKTTSTYTYVNKSNDKKYMQQLSIYKWLNQNIVTSDTGCIQFIFNDWTAVKAQIDPKYPKSKALEVKMNLMSIQETEQFITNKLNLLTKYAQATEDELPPCTPEDRWESPPTYAYYKNPSKITGRSTKNFDSLAEANNRLATDNGVGTVVTRLGKSKACNYCNAFTICNQAKTLLLEGRL